VTLCLFQKPNAFFVKKVAKTCATSGICTELDYDHIYCKTASDAIQALNHKDFNGALEHLKPIVQESRFHVCYAKILVVERPSNQRPMVWAG
jgi:hypothetical protein